MQYASERWFPVAEEFLAPSRNGGTPTGVSSAHAVYGDFARGHLEVFTIESTVSEIGLPLPRLWPRKWVFWRGADLPRSPHRPTEIADSPHRLTGPSFQMGRVAKDDFISPLIRTPAPGRWLRGGGAGNRGPAPSISGREEGRRGPGPSGAVATNHGPGREIRKSRLSRRQFTGPSFRTLIAANGGSTLPFLGAQSPGLWLRGYRVRNVALIKVRKEGCHQGPMGPGFLKPGRSNSGKSDGRNPGNSGTGWAAGALWGQKCRRRPTGKPEWPRVWPPPGTGAAGAAAPGRNPGLS